MALLFLDSFDHCGTNQFATVGKWASASNQAFGSTDYPRTGTYGCQLGGGSILTTKTLPASGGFVMGCAFRFLDFSANDIMRVNESSTTHMALAMATGGILSVKRGSTTLATAATPLVTNNYYYIEFKGIIHDTTGSYEVRIDGVTIAALTNAGPTDTREGGSTGQWNTVAIGHAAGSNWGHADDFYVCDTSGSAPRNTFLGPIKIEVLYPQTDAVAAGSNAGLTPSTGTDHGALVDEPSPNTTDYNSSATVGVKDTYQYPSMALTGTILGIQTNLYVQKSDAAARTVCAVVRAGGVDYDGAAVSPLTSWSYVSEVRAQNPNTSAEWTASDITALQAGMKVVS